LARTIADLAGAEWTQATHLVEAIRLRSTEKTELTDCYIAGAVYHLPKYKAPYHGRGAEVYERQYRERE
jgi:hypothetical protein